MTEPLSPADRTAMHASPELPDVPVWLDDVEGDEALAWVEERNAETRAEYEDDSAFIGLRDDVEAILDSPDKIPAVSEAAGMLYNLWTDGEHPRGLWRRTTWESYRAGAPAAAGPAGADASSSVGTSTNDAGGNTDTATGTQWDLLLDLDALGEAEDTTWVWHGAEVLRDGPLAGRRALVNLSEGGSDTDVTRELDFETHLERVSDWVTFTPLQNVAGSPAVAMPTGRAPDGMPIGVHLSARRGHDRVLLELASEYEAAHPFARIWD